MNKKSLFYWFVAVVCAALIFTGCPQEADDDDPGPQPKDVSASYSLKASEASDAGDAASGVTLASATELDGVVTLRLGGTVTGEYILKAPGSGALYTEGASFQPSANYWVDSTTTPAAGVYAAVYINGLADWTDSDASKVLAIKNTNQALRLYTNGTGLLDAEPAKPKLTDSSNQKTIYIPATDPVVRWKLYSAIPKNDTFGILIWNGGDGTTYAPKTARLELVEYNGYDASFTVGDDTNQTVKQNGYSKTVVVDYSGVTFAPAVTYTDVTADYPLAAGDSGINTIGNPGNLNAVAKQRTADGTVYITVTSTTALTGTTDFTIESGLWGPKREQAPAGKWADMAINFGAVFTPENTAKVLSIRSTNHALRYYKGAANIWSTLPAGPSSGDPNIYLPSAAADLPVKWRIYDTGTFAANGEAAYDVRDFGLLLWDSAPEKVITLEVYEHDSYTADTEYTSAGTLIAKIVIDYSNVVIN